MPTLDWLHRAAAFSVATQVPYRLLETVSHHGSSSPDKSTDNLLIHGDNLEALKALMPFYRGRIKCIFIDPPYNTQSAFAHYDDKLEHSQWLSMMLPRLELLRDLLSEDGSIWVTIDDNEAHYLKVLMDEVFGRGNFVANVVWRSSDNSNNDARTFSVDHNQVLVYSASPGWLTIKQDAVEKRTHFRNDDNDPRGPWFDGNPLNSPKPRENLKYVLTAPNGNRIQPPPNGWRWEPATMQEKLATGEIRFNENMTGIKRRTYLYEMKGLPPSTLWTDLLKTGHNRQAKSEQKNLDIGTDLFSTPKPERLLAEVLNIATNPGDLVLDCFIGSGTTAAVAQKLGRRWIGCDINKGAIQTTAKRLQGVMREQAQALAAANSQGELVARDDAPTAPCQLSFSTWRVNDYDLHIQHNEAVELACQHLGLTRTRTDPFFDGTRGAMLAKIIPLNHPLTPLDLEALRTELKNRPEEERDMLVVSLGQEHKAREWVAQYNHNRPVNKIHLIELRTDRKAGGFIKHEPMSVQAHLERDGNTLVVQIDDVVSPSIIARLDLQEGIFRASIPDWRAVVDCVLIDTQHDGEVFNVALADVPARKQDLVAGRYELPAPPTGATVAVKLIDMLGEECVVRLHA